MRVLTLGYLSIADADPVELIQAAAKAGFSAVGLRITGRRPEEDLRPEIVANPAAITRIRRCLSDCGMRLSNISTYHLYPEIRIEDLRPVVQASASMGADFMVAGCYDRERSRRADFLGRYGELAAASGMRIALEPVSYSAAASLGDAYDLVLAAQQANLGLLLDPLHLARGGDTPDRIRGIDPKRIFYAQLCDADLRRPEGMDLAEEARTMRLYPGEGSLPLAEFLRALPEGIEIEAEVPSRADRHLSADARAAILHQRVASYLERIGATGSAGPGSDAHGHGTHRD